MMAQRLLWLLNIGLGLALAWLWVDDTGQPRPHVWMPPAALAPGAIATAEAPVAVAAPNPAQYMATLDRPIFAPDRRPPPPPDAAPPAPPPDPLANFTLYGVYGSGEQGGILARSDGRLRRIRIGEGLGDWTVRSIKDREVTLSRADEVRVLKLAHVFGGRPKSDAGLSSMGAAKPPTGPPNLQAMQEQAMVEARERQRQNNELRRMAGLPPMKE